MPQSGSAFLIASMTFCFQFSIWDALYAFLRRLAHGDAAVFQFSIWDAAVKDKEGAEIQSKITFNSLFEMPFFTRCRRRDIGSSGAFNSLFEMRDAAVGTRIIYAQVVFQFSIWDAGSSGSWTAWLIVWEPFNSLFEMRRPATDLPLQRSRDTFNSLFEMPPSSGSQHSQGSSGRFQFSIWDAHIVWRLYRLGERKLSILYLRCAPPSATRRVHWVHVAFQFSIWDAGSSG